MASLGQELKRERELRSISLQDISEQTKIGVRLLKALESDQHDQLPGKFFTKAILRSYAKAIGADEDFFMNKLHEEVLLQEGKASSSPEKRRPIPVLPEPREGKPARRYLLLGLIGAPAAALAVLYALVLAPQGRLRPTRPGPTVEASKPAAEKGAALPELPPVVGAEPPAAAQGLRLELEYESDTWMSIEADGKVLVTDTRRAGTRDQFEAKTEFILQTGNAGGVRLRINGRPARPLGPKGTVRRDIRIRPDNLKDYLEPGA
jgi:cytoskeleton protein RodZ